jgi:hypothetical protein
VAPRSVHMSLFLIAIVVLLIASLHPYRFSYFYFDDFNCLFWAQQETVSSIIWQNLNPFSLSFRPFYMLTYWIMWKIFGLSALPFHIFAWMVHGLNVLLFYFLLRQITQSEFASALGTLSFAYQAIFLEVFYNFACVGEALCCFFFLLTLWIRFRAPTPMDRIYTCCILFILAFKSKEMAITLPVVWLMFELLIRRDGTDEPTKAHASRATRWPSTLRAFLIPGAVAVLLLLPKLPDMGGLVGPSQAYSSAHPYYADFHLRSLIDSYAWYFNALLKVKLRPQVWLVLWAFLSLFLAVIRSRWGLFFLSFVFIAFIPVILFVNHRFAYYWYIPSFGISGLIALATKEIQIGVTQLLPARILPLTAAVLFLLVCWSHYTVQRNLGKGPIEWVRVLSEENRSFINGLAALQPPQPHETAYFRSVPRFFDEISIKSATQVVFKRTDLDAKIVAKFPPQAKYRVSFNNSTVTLIPTQ